VQYRAAAAGIARQVADRECGPDCVDQLAARAFRRPLDDGERTQLHAMLDRDGFALVVEAVLQAPQFLYRAELGPPDSSGTVTLTPHELAAELGFLFLDSIPDDALWASAESGALARPEILAAHIDRLLALDRVRAHLDDVVLDWLEVGRVVEVGKDTGVFPELTPDLRGSMYDETSKFVHDVLWKRDGSLRALLLSQARFSDAALRAHYGMTGLEPTETGTIGYVPATRAGVLMQGSLLTVLASEKRESIIQRGIYIHRHFLCTPELGRPPFSAIAEVAPLTGKMSESQFAYYRAADTFCSQCHHIVDPPGRALEAFDGIGRRRTMDEIGQPIDDSATLVVDGVPHAITGAMDLAYVLANSDQVARCVVDQMVHHALGRELEDAPTRVYLYSRFDDSDRDILEIFRALATSPAFVQRRAP
jgi:uncharacterized protein DUF1592/uncharacterized protein DUF1588/uncharacterized protein DUF1595/uncharacterized protein DUF1585